MKLIVVTIMLSIATAAAVLSAPVTQTEQTVNDVFPGLATSSLKSARLVVDMPEGVILRSGQIKITQKDLDSKISVLLPSIRPQLKHDLFCLLEDAAAQACLYPEAYDWAVNSKTGFKGSQDEQIAAYLASRTKKLAISDSEAKRFYDENKSDMGGLTFAQSKDDIKKMLLNDKQRQANADYIAALGMRYLIDVNKDWAAKQYLLAMDNPVEKARKSGRPVLVDFSASYCPPCRMMAPFIEEIKKGYAGKLNFVAVDTQAEPVLGMRYGASSIPLLLFFDKTGKEVFRHVGFYSKERITAKLTEIGVK